MKIGEATQVYTARMNTLREQRAALYEQKKALEKGEIEMTNKEILNLKKSIDRADFNYENASKFMEGFNMQKNFLCDIESSKRAGEAAMKRADDYSKCLEVARRLARGDKVPPKDEQKLLEFSDEMYQMAKNMAAIAENAKRKKHKSLWEDENAAPEKSVEETVNNMECGMSMPPELPLDIDVSAE